MTTVPSLVELPLTRGEVAELWAFVHGDIMAGGIRQRLRASLGLCPRHTWAYAVVEIELWAAGAGARGGHQPFDVSVLYEDLLDQVASRLERPAGLLHRDPWRALVPEGLCRVCDVVGPEGDDRADRVPTGYAGANVGRLTEEANRLVHTTAWCRETEATWRPRVCPDCAGSAGDAPLKCRQHLLGSGELGAELATPFAVALREMAARLRGLTTSMTQAGPPATARQNAAWIETLGWFAGWRVPLALTQR